ncbi:MAG TPA: hypothetical protein VMW01_04315 [Williamwhitmania sp.]|nr:hypothetical protein [Williamwhitmania sp.]
MEETSEQLLLALTAGLVEGVNELGEKFQAVQLLPELKRIYPTQLRVEIVSARIYQTEDDCYFEITEDLSLKPDEGDLEEDTSLKSFKTERTSLVFVADENGSIFQPSVSALKNAVIFLVELDDFSKINATDLFSEQGADEIMERMESEDYVEDENLELP